MRDARAASPPPGPSDLRAVHIGVNRVDDKVFCGWLGRLRGAVNDARLMRDIADAAGAASQLLVDEGATYDAVVDALERAIDRLVDGDTLLVTYAGHGASLRGIGIEDDDWDEAWCLYDGVLLDDTIHDLLADVPEMCEVVIVTDACFAGGMLDGAVRSVRAVGGVQPRLADRRPGVPVETVRREAMAGALESGVAQTPGEAAEFAEAVLGTAGVRMSASSRGPATRRADEAIGRLVRAGRIPPGRFPAGVTRRPIVASVVSLEAAAEGELAFEGDDHGLFTAALVEVTERLEKRYGEPPTVHDVMAAVARSLQRQRPNVGAIGRDAAAAANIKLASIGPPRRAARVADGRGGDDGRRAEESAPEPAQRRT